MSSTSQHFSNHLQVSKNQKWIEIEKSLRFVNNKRFLANRGWIEGRILKREKERKRKRDKEAWWQIDVDQSDAWTGPPSALDPLHAILSSLLSLARNTNIRKDLTKSLINDLYLPLNLPSFHQASKKFWKLIFQRWWQCFLPYSFRNIDNQTNSLFFFHLWNIPRRNLSTLRDVWRTNGSPTGQVEEGKKRILYLRVSTMYTKRYLYTYVSRNIIIASE